MKQHDMADAMIFVHKLLFKVNYPHLRLFNGEIHKSIEYQNFQNIYLSLVLFFKTFSIMEVSIDWLLAAFSSLPRCTRDL